MIKSLYIIAKLIAFMGAEINPLITFVSFGKKDASDT